MPACSMFVCSLRRKYLKYFRTDTRMEMESMMKDS